MKQKLVGEVIYNCRKNEKISQTQLSKGLCSISTLSRIESGERSVDSLLVENLLQRLGKSCEQFEFVLDYVDFKLSNLRYEIIVNLNNQKNDLVREQLALYSELEEKSNKIHIQFISMVELELLTRESADRSTRYKKALETIQLTIPDFSLEHLNEEYCLSLFEVRSILLLILSMESVEQKKELLGQLYTYIESKYDSVLLGMIGPDVLYYYANILLNIGDYKAAIDYCETGITMIQKAKTFMRCADICYVQACAISELLKSTKQENKELFDKAKDRMRQAYWTYSMEDNFDMMKKIEATWKELI